MRTSMILFVCIGGILTLIVPPTGMAQSSYIEHIVDDVSSDQMSVCTADIDGDGDTDIVFVAAQNDKIAWWENVDGLGINLVEHVIASNYNDAYSVQISDIDSDGDIDVIGAARGMDRVSWWENQNGSGLLWSEHVIDASTMHPSEIQASDIDGDGDDDVVAISYIDDYVVWWENNVAIDPVWEQHDIDLEFASAYGVDAADMDGDGDTDVICSGNFIDEIAWWENVDGTGESWTKQPVSVEVDGPCGLEAADIDNDGDMDFAVALSWDDDIAWIENLVGSGTEWSLHTVPFSLSSPNDVTAVDFDYDGDIDLIGVGRNGPFSVYLWTNFNGLGTQWVDNQIGENFYGGNTIHTADMDGDQDLDVLGSADVLNRVSWWEQNQPLSQFQVELIPYQDVIPAEGGQYFFRVAVINETGHWQCGDIWTETYTAYGQLISPLAIRTMAIPEGSFVSDIFSQVVPWYTTPGFHRITINFGEFDQRLIAASDWASCIKLGAIASGYNSWDSSPIVFSFDDSYKDVNDVAIEDPLVQTYPNPFNASTKIQVRLPNAADLSVVVYNVTGQQVATLAYGWKNAGTHTFIFDASDLASGLYFISATVPGELDQMQKVMLIR